MTKRRVLYIQRLSHCRMKGGPEGNQNLCRASLGVHSVCISARSQGRCEGPASLDPDLAGHQDQRLVLEGAGDPPILTLPLLSTEMKLSPICSAFFPTTWSCGKMLICMQPQTWEGLMSSREHALCV